jgi:hypothetical protein
MDENIAVPLGPCACDGTPHPEGDVVYLRPKLGMARAMAVIQGATFNDIKVAEMQLAIGYARFGIADWNLSNGDGKKRELDGDHLQAFAEEDPRALLVAMRGDGLYADEVLRPLATLGAVSSPTTPTTAATSATNGTKRSTRRRPKPPKPSSTTTTQTDDTVTITASLDGDSSS